MAAPAATTVGLTPTNLTQPAVAVALTPTPSDPNYWVLVTRTHTPNKLAQLTQQMTEVRKAAHVASNDILPALMFREGPFPNGATETEAICVKAIVKAAHKHGYTEIVSHMETDDAYAKLFIPIVRDFLSPSFTTLMCFFSVVYQPRQRLSNIRSDAIQATRPVTKTAIDFSKFIGPEKVCLAMKAFLLNDGYIFPGDLDITVCFYLSVLSTCAYSELDDEIQV